MVTGRRPRLNRVIVTGNEASSYTGTEGGGGIYVSGGTPTPTYSDVYDNSPDDYSGMSDPVGTDGNVSVDPAFEEPDRQRCCKGYENFFQVHMRSSFCVLSLLVNKISDITTSVFPTA